MKRLLVLGGTRFVGRAIVEEALAKGWHVTLFHRGQTGDSLFVNDIRVTHIHGDRNVSFDPLAGLEWDAMVDACAYFPHQVASAAEALKGRVKATAFISTISVYAPGPVPDESSPLLTMPEGVDASVVTGETYGPLKVQCEEVFLEAWPEALIARAGLQIGPTDYTWRFTDWVERIGRRSQVVVPGGGAMPWQAIDSRDMAVFIVDHLERNPGGIFNLTGEVGEMPARLELIRQVVNPGCELIEKPWEWLQERGIEAWKELALWLPAGERDGFPVAVSIDKALGAGIAFRPLEETVQEIWDAVRDLPVDRPRLAGLTPEREDALFA